MQPNGPISWATLFFTTLCVINLATAPLYLRIIDIGPISIGFFRLFFSLPFLALWLVWTNRTAPSPNSSLKDRILMTLCGISFAGDLTLWNQSVQMTTIVNSCLLNNFSTFFVPIFATLLFGVTWNWFYLFAGVIAFSGSILLTGAGACIGANWVVGDTLALCSSVSYALYLVTIGDLRKRLDTATIFLWSGISCTLTLGLLAWLFAEPFWPQTVAEIGILVAYAFFVQLGGQGLAGYVMGKLPTNLLVLILMLCPFCATVLGWILFDESLTVTQGIGGLIILGSILYVNYMEKRVKNTLPISQPASMP